MNAVRREVSEQTLQEIVRRIVDVAQPDRIILFGSAARGSMTWDSDVDLLVIKREPFHQGRLTGEIYTRLIGVGQAGDVLLTTPEEIERFRECPGLMVASALREGRVIYAQ